MLTSTLDYVAWKILNDDGLSADRIAEAWGWCSRTIRAGIEKACLRIVEDDVICMIYEQARKEYLCSNSVHA